MQTTLTELANLLGVQEFDLFEQAYTYWYGQRPKPTELESDFGKYIMNQNNLPIYVKGYMSKPHFLIA